MNTFSKDDGPIPMAQVMNTSSVEEDTDMVPNEVNSTLEHQTFFGNRDSCRKISLSENWQAKLFNLSPKVQFLEQGLDSQRTITQTFGSSSKQMSEHQVYLTFKDYLESSEKATAKLTST